MVSSGTKSRQKKSILRVEELTIQTVLKSVLHKAVALSALKQQENVCRFVKLENMGLIVMNATRCASPVMGRLLKTA